jgi:hypothetical protein
MAKPTNDARVSRGPFEDSAFDRFDVRVLLPERPDIDPLRHPSGWFDAGGADLPDPVAL